MDQIVGFAFWIWNFYDKPWCRPALSIALTVSLHGAFTYQIKWTTKDPWSLFYSTAVTAKYITHFNIKYLEPI